MFRKLKKLSALQACEVKKKLRRRYMKLKEDMPLSAAKIEDDTLASGCSASKQIKKI